MRPMRTAGWALLLFGCGGGGDGGGPPQDPNLPPAAVALESALKAGMGKQVRKLAGFESGLVSMLVPTSPLSQGIAMTPDASPGAAPHSYTLAGDWDGNDDGHRETALSGHATFSAEPASGWSGVQGRVTGDATILGLLHVYHGDLNFEVGSDIRRLWGAGTFDDPATGNKTTTTIDAAGPLVVKPASGAADSMPNFCGWSARRAACRCTWPVRRARMRPCGTSRTDSRASP